VLIENLKIVDFEISGITINGGHKIKVKNVEIGGILNKVWLKGNYLNLKTIRGYIRTLAENGDLCEPSSSEAYL